MKTGTISKAFPDRGFFFIHDDDNDDGTPDVFLHISAIKSAGMNEPSIGDRLAYDLAPGKNGRMQAANPRAA